MGRNWFSITTLFHRRHERDRRDLESGDRVHQGQLRLQALLRRAPVVTPGASAGVQGARFHGRGDALWARSLRDQCKAANVQFFFKQWGEWATRETWALASRKPQTAIMLDGSQVDHDAAPQDVGGQRFEFVGKRAAGRLLDGAPHEEYPTTKGNYRGSV